MKSNRIIVSEYLLEMLAKGKVKYVKDKKIKLGRWILKDKVGEFIGSESKAKNKK